MTTLAEATQAIENWGEQEYKTYQSVYVCLQEQYWGKDSTMETPLGTFTIEDQVGGEGQGDTYYIVVSLTHPDGTKEYFRYNGFYSSWDGVYWEDTEDEKVVPQEKTIIEWVSTKE